MVASGINEMMVKAKCAELEGEACSFKTGRNGFFKRVRGNSEGADVYDHVNETVPARPAGKNSVVSLCSHMQEMFSSLFRKPVNVRRVGRASLHAAH